ncbi:hypothetical protein [Streptococcus pyogenes]|uniref:hypothetical protein n=1 Tax=Streptococcus pyogenes TaxID=1314 RepID=UPI0010D9AACE|nr:hypothetical protein [Streptococcus pyogenes]VGS57335.1 Uncharacterised protein [Streptococcus pyogenes]VGT97253.1 Uncharacterised protein [Streptococcus pyogenes]
MTKAIKLVILSLFLFTTVFLSVRQASADLTSQVDRVTQFDQSNQFLKVYKIQMITKMGIKKVIARDGIRSIYFKELYSMFLVGSGM